MEDLESQVAKIQIGTGKDVNSYVFVLAEKAPVGEAELYILAELPLFNPAALESCQKISLSIASSLKRAYRKPGSENTFETGIAQINEELGKLAEMGQTTWIDKLNCIIAAKEGDGFSIATCGKVSSYLYRTGEFTDISCSQQLPHPLKTFENVAFGKIKLHDMLILSTTQLFNHISIDRLKKILEDNSFLHAAQIIIEILKENAGPEVAFGTVLNLQVNPGETETDAIDLENYQTNEPQTESILSRAFKYAKGAFAVDSMKKRMSKASLPQISFSGSLQNVKDSTKSWTAKSKQLFSQAATGIKNTNPAMPINKVRSFSKWKKVLFFSVLFLICAVILEISIARRLKKTTVTQTAVTGQLQEVQTLLNDAQSKLLYKDDGSARDYLAQAQAKMPSQQNVPPSDQNLYNQTLTQIQDLQMKFEKAIMVTTTNVGSLGQGQSLFSLGGFLATQINSTIVSYDKTTGSISDANFLSSEKLMAAAYLGKTSAIVYNGKSLLVWDFVKKQFSEPFTLSVPAQSDWAGLKIYATNNRVYLIDKKTNQIINFLIGNTISKPVVTTKNANDLGNALDLAIDGSIYVLNTNGVSKYQAGSLVNFKLPTMATAFSGQGKISTDKDWSNIYILDIGNNRILVIDKKGNLVATLKSKDFTKLKDFVVDEKSKTAYILNDGSLLKITLP